MHRQTSLGLGPAAPDTGETDTQQVESAALNSPAPAAILSNSQLSRLNFPSKLHHILRASEYNDIICWLPHGRSWRVLQQGRFEKEVLPIFFRHGRYASFARQINGWGFRRISSGTDFNSYYHELFLRDAPELCLQMTRPSATELADRKKEEPDSPPNFYLMSKVEPTASDANNNPQASSDDLQAAMVNGLDRSAMQDDEYMSNLMRLISMISPHQQSLILEIELNNLNKQRQAVLEKMELLSARLPIFPPRSALPYHFRPQPSVDRAAAAALQPVRNSLHRAALDLYLRSQVTNLQTGLAIGTAAGGSNNDAS